jgi:hypothetical protein
MTLIAAEKTGRRGYCIEIYPAYLRCRNSRLRAVCSLEAVLEAAGQGFGEVQTNAPNSRGCTPGTG